MWGKARACGAFLACWLAASASYGQGDGPRTQLLLPVGTNILAPTLLDLSSNFNFAQDILIEGAEISSEVGVFTYTRSFALGDRYAQVWVNPIWGSVSGDLSALLPGSGRRIRRSPEETGFGDPYVAIKVGLIGAPALAPAEFVQHRPTFQLYGYLGSYVPVGDYESTRVLNLGTNRWAVRLGLPMVVPLGDPRRMTFLEMHPGVVFYTDNTDPFRADRREQAPLYLFETHLSHNLLAKLWASIDLRYQHGGETTTDGVADENRISQLGGGLTVGYSFTRSLGLQVSYSEILVEDDGAEGEMLRARLTYAF